MKWKVFSSAMFIAGLTAFGILAIEVEEAEAVCPIQGTWDVNYYWEESSVESSGIGEPGVSQQGTTVWYISMFGNLFGTFTSSEGDSGVVVYFARRERVFVIYQTDCKQVYMGTRDGNDMSGEMWCRDGSEDRGTWDAQKRG